MNSLDIRRAEQILDSPEKIDVLFEGKSIWIHNLNIHYKTAEISYENNPEEYLNVPINNLIEKNSPS